MDAVKGIDVSRYQGIIDWQAVADSGISFAMIKALQGASAIDKRFLENAEGASKAGLPFGIYVYSKASSEEEATAEAQAALELAADFSLAYPIAMDIEGEHYRLLTKEKRIEVVDAFCSAVKAAGQMPLLYSNKDWLTNVIPEECTEKWDVWLAQWRKTAPDYQRAYTMWQYGKAQVSGISTKVDMDLCYFDYPAAAAKNVPLHFAVTTPRIKGEAALKMQLALIAANYKDANGDPIIPDGVWGMKSQSALDKLVNAQKEN